jgi:NRPS condensation-like uncharacterized protein
MAEIIQLPRRQRVSRTETERQIFLRALVRNLTARDLAHLLYHAVLDERGNERYLRLLTKALAMTAKLRPVRLPTSIRDRPC